MKNLLLIVVFLVFSSTITAQSNLFERENLTPNKNLTEKIDLYKNRGILESWEVVELKQDVVLTKGYKGVFNICEREFEFEITKEFETDKNGVKGFKADIEDGGYAILSTSSEGIGASIWRTNGMNKISIVF